MLLGAADTLPRFLTYNCYVLAVFNLRQLLFSALIDPKPSFPMENGYILVAVIPYRKKMAIHIVVDFPWRTSYMCI